MADWVHCNLCYRQPGNGVQFSLTNCGHIYCRDCIKSGTSEKCHICGKSPCLTILLAAKMKPDVEVFFTDPIEIAKKNHKQLLQVMEFQKNHRDKLTAHHRQQKSSTMQNAQKAIGQLKDLERKVMLLTEENAYLKKIIGSMGGSQNARMSGLSPVPHRMKGSVSPTNAAMNKQKQKYQETHSNYVTNNITPVRISVRTPPSHGRMGSIPCTPPTSLGLTPVMMDANTPGGMTSNTTFMKYSPARERMTVSGSPSPGLPLTSTGSYMMSYSPVNSKSPGVPQRDSRRAIQLNYSQSTAYKRNEH